ncbi:MAG: hypothetical protein EAZ64_08880 [Sphingobacteriales bacterium]|nr:MAG: hypothetical protein EAZ64_08880 [Sphingobacteriales bacterium]
MQIEVYNTFYRDLKKVPEDIKKIVPVLFDKLREVKNIESVGIGLEKMSGFKIYYRYKYKSFRIGLKVENDTVFVMRILDRKDIYKYFPTSK